MYWPVNVSHPPVKMSSLNACTVLGHIIKAYVCMEGSLLPRDCLEESNCTVYWKKHRISDFFCYSTELDVLNEQLLGGWFCMQLNNQHAFWFPLYSMYCSRGMLLEKRMVAFLYFSIFMKCKVQVTPRLWGQTPDGPFA